MNVIAVVLMSCAVQLPTTPALEKGLVLEQQEHDAQGALAQFMQVARDESAPAAVRRRAWLRVGMLLQRTSPQNEQEIREALEKAALGDDEVAARAKRLLQDPAPDDERVRAVRQRAEELVEKVLVQSHESQAFSDLAWLGHAAVPVIIRKLEQVISGELTATYWWQLSRLIWKIGGPDALDYIERIRSSGDVAARRLVSAGIPWAPPTRHSTAELWLEDPDEKVVLNAIAGASKDGLTRFAVSAWLPLLEHSSDAVRVAVLSQIVPRWAKLRHDPDRATTSRLLVPHLRQLIGAVDPAVDRAARACLSVTGMASREGRQLLIQALRRRQLDGLNIRSPSDDQVDPIGPDDDALALLELLRELGPPRSDDERMPVSGVLWVYHSYWRRAALPTVLEAARLGYIDAKRFVPRHALPEDAARVIEALAGTYALTHLHDWLSRLDLTPDCWPGLRRHVDEYPEEFDAGVCVAIGRTGVADSAGFLLERLGKKPNGIAYQVVTEGLLWLASENPSPDVRKALRQALITAVEESNSGPHRTRASQKRSQLFGRLVRLGDGEAMDLLDDAIRLGMHATRPFEGGNWHVGQPGSAPAGFSWLATTRWHDGELEYWHGFDDSTWASCWEQRLKRTEHGTWPWEWNLLYLTFRGDWRTSSLPNDRHVPDGYVNPLPIMIETACRLWQQRLAIDPAEPTDPRTSMSLYGLLDIGRVRATNDAGALAAIGKLHDTCHEFSAGWVRLIALDMLPAELDDAQGQRVVDALSDPDPKVAARARELASHAEIEISAELLGGALRSESEHVRFHVVKDLAPLVGNAAVPLVTELLRDPSAGVRAEACRFLGTQVRRESVQPLLEALKDVEASVREAAALALTAIRFYHEEKAHWDRAFGGGPDVSKNAAAEALLKQAAPENDRDTRLLAIRSLGQVGVAETLPFLITWSKDRDAEIAAAAREAIARIHARK